MTDTETAAAIEALAHRVKLRDQAIRDSQDFADAEVFAAEFITAMRGYGWRHTEARVFAPPKPAVAASGTAPRDELLTPVRAQLDALNAAKRAREDGAA
jgi:hypothetical protein